MIKNEMEVTLTEDDVKLAEDLAQTAGEYINELVTDVYTDCKTDEDYEKADVKRELLLKEIIKSISIGFGLE